MNILFFSLGNYKTISEKGIYTDLLREFIKNKHNVIVLSANEKRVSEDSCIIKEEKCLIIEVYTGRIQKTNAIEKGINTILIETRYKNAIKKYCKEITFDLVLYPTPPITFVNVVKYVKKRDNAKTYLLLKDIFPQNAVDIEILSKTGLKGILYKYFREKEKKLYNISDYIGCMSPANVEYVIKHNSQIDPNIVEVCPNCVEVTNKSIDEKTKNCVRKKYNIPFDKKIFVYGGNLGKPQGIDFLIKCLYSQRSNEKIFFLIIGDGTEYDKLNSYILRIGQKNLKLMKSLPKEDYDKIIAACDVGMIFLDYRFTIPNFPSRLLGYLQAQIPVLACTDLNTDIGKIILNANFGWWCTSRDLNEFNRLIDEIQNSDIRYKGKLGYEYLKKEYNVNRAYKIIRNRLNEITESRNTNENFND